MNNRTPRRAFTITELLVVISIIVLLIAIAVPALSSLMNSSERSLAENQLRAALSAAHDAAVQSETGDAAAVFFYNVDNNGQAGNIVIVACVVVGQLDDVDVNAQGQPGGFQSHRRDVLVPVPSIAPVQLPRGWVVSAYAPPNTLSDATTLTEPWYWLYTGATTVVARQAGDQWVTPETSFFDSTLAGASKGACRRSFMVRFKVGTGELDTGNQTTAVVFDPVNVTQFRTVEPFATYRGDELRLPGTPAMIAPNAATWVRRVLGPRGLDPVSRVGEPTWRDEVLGAMSPDSVLVRPVTELALYEQLKLAASIGASGLNRTTGTMYGNLQNPRQMPIVPTLDPGMFGAGLTPQDVSLRVSQWIEGRYTRTGAPGPTASDARIFTVQRYLGQIQELVP